MDRPRRRRGRELRRPGLDRRRRRGRPGSRRRRPTSAVWSGLDGHDYAFRVRARDLKGNIERLERDRRLRLRGLALEGRRLRPRPGRRAVRSASAADTTRDEDRHAIDSGDVVAIIGGPRVGRRLHLVPGRRAAHASGTPSPLDAARRWVAARGPARPGCRRPRRRTRPGSTPRSAISGSATPAPRASARRPAAAAHRAFSPNGDGSGDTLPIDWTNDRAFDSLILRVFRADGTLVGDVPIRPARRPARTSSTGTAGSAPRRLPNGRYLVSLVGSAGGADFYNPAASFRGGALARYGVTIDTVSPVVTAASSSSTPDLAERRRDPRRVTRQARAPPARPAGPSAPRPSPARRSAPPVATGPGAGGSVAVTWTGRTNAGAVVARRLVPADAARPPIDAGNRAPRSWTVRVDDTPRHRDGDRRARRPSRRTATAPRTRAGSAGRRRERITRHRPDLPRLDAVRSWTVTARTAGAIAWNGRTRGRPPSPDGTYPFRITGRDAAGNARRRTSPVMVDRTLSSLRWSRAVVRPAGRRRDRCRRRA